MPPQPLIADVFLQPSKSIIVHTTPGRDVKFFGGHAQIKDHRDMPHMLAREDARVIPTEYGLSWAEDWLKHTSKINAVVEWPEGYTVSHTNSDEWEIIRPDGYVSDRSPSSPAVGVVEHGPPAQPLTGSFPSGKSIIDMLLDGPENEPQPMIPNHKPHCRCFRCVKLRKEAAA